MYSRNTMVVAVVFPFLTAQLNAEALPKGPLEMVQSDNPDDRVKGFYDLIKPAVISGQITYTCEFNSDNTGKVKILLGQLLRKEINFDFDKDYFARYGVKVSGKELHARKKEKEIMRYLSDKEGYGVYLANLQDFMDSCEEESLVDLFPGPRTFNRYLQKSTEAAFVKIEDIKKPDNSGNRNKSGFLIILGDAAIKNKKLQPQLYNSVKAKLIELSENDCLADRAIGVMGQMRDSDFIPILEKISHYDNSRGCSRIIDGQKTVFPISRAAKRALKHLQKAN